MRDAPPGLASTRSWPSDPGQATTLLLPLMSHDCEGVESKIHPRDKHWHHLSLPQRKRHRQQERAFLEHAQATRDPNTGGLLRLRFRPAVPHRAGIVENPHDAITVFDGRVRQPVSSERI